MSNKKLWVARYRRAGDEDSVHICQTKEVAENLVRNFLANALAQHNVMPPTESYRLSLDILDTYCDDIAYFDIDEMNLLEEHDVYQPLSRSIGSIQSMINRIVEVKSLLPTYNKDQNNFVSIGLLYDLVDHVFNQYNKTGFIAEPHEGEMKLFNVSVSNTLPLEKIIERTLFDAFQELYEDMRLFPKVDIRFRFVPNKVYVYVVELILGKEGLEVGDTINHYHFSFQY